MIPADKSQNGVGSELNDRNQIQLRAIILGAPGDSQLGAFYKSYMNSERLEQLDAKPLKPDIQRIAAIKTKAEFVQLMAHSLSGFGATLIGVAVIPDFAKPDLNVAGIFSSGMGMPDREFYLNIKHKKERDAYRAYVQRAFDMAGFAKESILADDVMAFETEIAWLSWSQTELRDIGKLNNPMSLSQLQEYAPRFDWSIYLTAAKIRSGNMIVGDKSAVEGITELFDHTALDTLKAWQYFHLIDQASDYLSERFVASKFQYTKALSGSQAILPRWRRGIAETDERLGELLGKAYVERYFSADAKSQVEKLVANLKLAAGQKIDRSTWMGAATKKEALAKLAKMDVMVGYPDKFRDYSKLQLNADDLYGNIKRCAAFEWKYKLSDLNKAVDRKKWLMSPATVDAYNGWTENKIVFPAGLLQPPFFDPKADAAVNYGAAGAIIGHEIMHGFDDQGRKIDANGAVRDWWTKDDAARFNSVTEALRTQYSAYEAAPGVFINGALTIGENIGDMSGLDVAYTAYRLSLNGKPAPVVEGLTGDQRFFLAFAQAWRGKQRDEAIKTQVASDEHSPRRFRVIGPLRNLDAWYEAFSVGPDSKFYIPPDQRVRIW